MGLPRKQVNLRASAALLSLGMTTTSLRARLRACRSFLLTPGSRPDTFTAARTSSGDAIIVDLESTVAPNDKKRARENALSYLRQAASEDLARLVRINSPRSVEGLRDLLALHESDNQPDAIVIPKCESADELRLVADVLDGAQSTIIEPAMLREAERVIAIASKVSSNAPASAQGSPS